MTWSKKDDHLLTMTIMLPSIFKEIRFCTHTAEGGAYMYGQTERFVFATNIDRQRVLDFVRNIHLLLGLLFYLIGFESKAVLLNTAYI